MQWQFHFRQVDVSSSLKEYARAHFERLEPYLVKESSWKVHFGMGKYDYEVEVWVANTHGKFKAKAYSEISLYAAVDEAVDKLSRQFLKRKARLQAHNKFERSKQGKLLRLNSQLEYDNRPYRQKKSA